MAGASTIRQSWTKAATTARTAKKKVTK
eukprot:COSAG02_NODE_63997_length_261_cov_1.734568_1_plen_27_part_01